MGQRIQIVVQIPAIYWNEDNPNNKPEKVLVYHNQWLFGMNFVQYNARLIKAIKAMIKRQSSEYPIEYKDLVAEAILHANNYDLSYITNTHIYDNDCDNNNEDLIKAKSASDFLSFWDNNNGYFYIKISDDKEVYYDILSGLEDADEVKAIGPKKYLNQFYTDAKIIDMGAYEAIKAIHYLQNSKRIDCLKELTKFREELKKLGGKDGI